MEKLNDYFGKFIVTKDDVQFESATGLEWPVTVYAPGSEISLGMTDIVFYAITGETLTTGDGDDWGDEAWVKRMSEKLDEWVKSERAGQGVIEIAALFRFAAENELCFYGL